MMFGQCGSCRYWKLNVAAPEAEWSTCARAETNDGRTKGESLAYAHDGIGYHADLVTNQSFGCNQFEQEDAEHGRVRE